MEKVVANLATKTLMYLQDQGINSYEDLCEKQSAVSAEFSAISKKIKEAETRMKEISELQKQIGVYGKTRDNYRAYINSGKDASLYDVYVSDIILHKAAKKYFDGLGLKKLPKMADLKIFLQQRSCVHLLCDSNIIAITGVISIR